MDRFRQEGFRSDLHTVPSSPRLHVQVPGESRKLPRLVSDIQVAAAPGICSRQGFLLSGFSPPSPVSDPVAIVAFSEAKQPETEDERILKEARSTLLSGHIVELIEAVAVSSTSVKLVWEVRALGGRLRPARTHSALSLFLQIFNSDFVEGFYIYSRALDGANRGADSYSMLTVLHAGGALGFQVTGLHKYTRYEFFLVPFYRSIEGKPSNSRTTRTLEDREYLRAAGSVESDADRLVFLPGPSEPPSHMEATLLNSTAVHLKWKAPPAHNHNGVIRSYVVVVEGTGINNVTVSTSSPSLLLTNLTAGVTYTVRTAAATRVGPGPFSAPATLRLDPASRLLLRDQQNR